MDVTLRSVLSEQRIFKCHRNLRGRRSFTETTYSKTTSRNALGDDISKNKKTKTQKYKYINAKKTSNTSPKSPSSIPSSSSQSDFEDARL